jgi:hypothetical protein
MAKQTDNHNPEAKLLLRRYFLEKYHPPGTATVFDCCQGGAIMWTTIRETHTVATYWGVDLKPKKGRMKIDSIRVIQQGLKQNVIDVDTYGSPWKHWSALLPNVDKPTTVFLTIGNQNTTAMSPESHGASQFCTFPPSTPEVLKGLVMRWRDVDFALASAVKLVTITEAVESVSTGNARYIGVRLEPLKNGQQSLPADRKQTSVMKELKNV